MTLKELLPWALVVLLYLLFSFWRGRRVERRTPQYFEPEAPEPPARVRPRPPIRPVESPLPREAPLPASTPPAPVRRVGRSRLGSLPEVRRGIVLMTVLGPCRARDRLGS